MPDATVTRRTLILAAAAAPLAGCATTGAPLPRTPIRSIRIDVSPLVDKGLPNYAQKVAAGARVTFAHAFADRLAPNDRSAPEMVVRIDTVTLVSSLGSGGMFSDDRDDMRGALILGSAPPRPLVALVDPRDSGPWFRADAEDRRLARLLVVYAAWARKEFAD